MLKLVVKLKADGTYNPIVCMPDHRGPLAEVLSNHHIETIEMPVLLVTRAMLKRMQFGKLFLEYKIAKSILNKTLTNKKIVAVQSNTLATLLGYFYTKKAKLHHIVHVHEILERPRFIKYLFGWCLKFFSDQIVYNSKATQSFYNGYFKSLEKKSCMIYNGVDRLTPRVSSIERTVSRKKIFDASNEDVLIGLVGRINRLKGHQLLLNVFKRLKSNHKNIKLCFVGSPPDNQDYFLTNLKATISVYNLEEAVTILPFQKDVYRIIDLLDIVTVPSTEPESFGIIAVEAMLSNKPVIASRLGGLLDIIEDEETGILFEPNDEDDFYDKLDRLLKDDTFRNSIANKASLTAANRFSSENMYTQFLKVYNSIEI